MKKRFNISRIFKQRDNFFQTIRTYIDLEIVSTTFTDFVNDLYRGMPKHISHDAVFESCRAIAGEILTRKTAAEFAWRLAGNVDALADGRPVIPWTRQIRDEWVPVQITHVDPTTRRGKFGYLFRCRALAGTYCPFTFEQFFSRGSCTAISRLVGFSRTLPYTNPSYLTGLRMLAYVEASKSIEQPQFQQFDCSPSMRAFNKKIIEIRTRRRPCPRNFDRECAQCPVGADQCKASIFLRGLEQRYCAKCNKVTHFDLTRSDELCLGCWTAKKLRHTAGT